MIKRTSQMPNYYMPDELATERAAPPIGSVQSFGMVEGSFDKREEILADLEHCIQVHGTV